MNNSSYVNNIRHKTTKLLTFLNKTNCFKNTTICYFKFSFKCNSIYIHSCCVWRGNMDNSTLGERIKKARKRLNLTQEQLGEMADVTSAYIGQMERNERTPSLKRLKKVAKQLDVSVEYLVVGTKSSAEINEDLKKELDGINEQQKQLITEVIRIVKKYT